VMPHIPSCRKWCIENNFRPLCTCDSCEGLQTHPPHDLPLVATRKRSSGGGGDQLTSQASPVESMEETTLGTHARTQVRQLLGQTCVICGAKKSPANITLPTIHVGRYRVLRVCVKKHLTKEAASRLLLERVIDQELKEIEKNGDHMLDETTEGSQEDRTEDGEKELQRCSGLKDLTDETRCTTQTPPHLWVLQSSKGKEVKKFFCKGSVIILWRINNQY